MNKIPTSSHPHPGQSPQMGVPTQPQQAQMVYQQAGPTQSQQRQPTPQFYTPTMPQNIRQPGGQPRQPLNMSPAAQQYGGIQVYVQPGGQQYLAQQPQHQQMTFISQGGIQVQYPNLVRGQTPQYAISPQTQQPYQVPQQHQYHQYPTQPNNPATVYYPTNNINQQRPMSQPVAATPVYNPKRERKILQITDPNTGKCINEDLISSQQGGGSQQSTPPPSATSTSSSPPPVQSSSTNTQIAAQFAAQVAATLSNSKRSEEAGAEPVPVSPQPAHQTPEAGDAVDNGLPPEMPPQEPVIVEKSEPVVAEVPVEATPPPPCEPTPPTTDTAEPKQETTPPPEATKPDTPQVEVSPAQSVQPIVADTRPSEPISKPSVPETVVDKPRTANVEENVEVEVEVPVQEQAATPTVAEPVIEEVEEITVTVTPPTPQPVKASEPPPVKHAPTPPPQTRDTVTPDTTTKPQESTTQSSSEQATTTEKDEAIFKTPQEPPAVTKDVVVNNIDAKVADGRPEPPQPAPSPAATPAPPDTPEHVEITVVEKEPIVQNGKPDEEPQQEQEDAKEVDPATNNTEDREQVKNKTELKYKYREDQWSPLNMEGKKSYDRKFLLNLQFVSDSMSKPDGLPRLPDVILDKPMPMTKGGSSTNNMGSEFQLRPGSGLIDFTPGFIKTSPRPGQGGGGSMGRRSQQRDGRDSRDRGQGQGQGQGPPRKIINISVGQDIKLHTAEKAWVPSVKGPSKDKEMDDDTTSSEELYKKVRSILNKLTPQKFKTLVGKILELEIDSEIRLKTVIDLIFEKALDEPGFSVAYANMCKCLQPLKVPAENPTKEGEKSTFRKLLITRCQREFERESAAGDREAKKQEILAIEDAAKRKLDLDEYELAELKAKRRMLGNIRFIGELFKLKMLVEPIMHDCIMKLLKSNDEESYECLCRLLTTIGKDIDHEEAEPLINQYVDQMHKIIKSKKISSRVRFMLQDVVELRRNKWVPRRQDNNPKTIDQIHKEIQQEEVERAQLIQTLHMQQKQQGGQGRMRGSRGSNQGMNQQKPEVDGWNTVGAKTSRAPLDPSKMRLTKQKLDDPNIQLGPGGGMSRFSSWGRGSGGGGTKPQEPERATTPTNRFSALSGPSAPSAPAAEQDQRGHGGFATPRGAAPSARSSERGRPMQNTPRGGKRSSQDREAALAAARDFGGGRPSGQERAASRDNSRNREEERAPEVPEPKPVELTEEQIEKKTKSILDEYLHIQDKKEALMCVEELQSPGTIHMFVYSALSHVLERSSQARRQTGTFLHDVVKNGAVTVDSYIKGLQELLSFADDMEIDIPKIWSYLGELISPMVQDGSVRMLFLKQAFQPLLRCNKAGVLVAEVLHDASTRLGHHTVGELWKQSGLQWADFLPEGVSRTEFIHKHKLEFTIDSDTPLSPTIKQPIEVVRRELNRLIEEGATNEAVFDWIEANAREPQSRDAPFIRALMTAVCNSAIKGSLPNDTGYDSKEIQKRQALLQRYLDHQPDLELQALFALQALVHELEHPPGLLRSIFDTLYDEDIISEDAFFQWETNMDPNEQEGKGVARKSVVQFFTWLREADEENDT